MLSRCRRFSRVAYILSTQWMPRHVPPPASLPSCTPRRTSRALSETGATTRRLVTRHKDLSMTKKRRRSHPAKRRRPPKWLKMETLYRHQHHYLHLQTMRCLASSLRPAAGELVPGSVPPARAKEIDNCERHVPETAARTRTCMSPCSRRRATSSAGQPPNWDREQARVGVSVA